MSTSEEVREEALLTLPRQALDLQMRSTAQEFNDATKYAQLRDTSALRAFLPLPDSQHPARNDHLSQEAPTAQEQPLGALHAQSLHAHGHFYHRFSGERDEEGKVSSRARRTRQGRDVMIGYRWDEDKGGR